MNLAAVLALGFFLGMRHATDADHVVAVSTIVSRERTLRAAAPIGALWGLGHTLTILLVGGAIILFGIVIPPRLGLGMELSVAIMLVLLGGLNVKSILQDARSIARLHGTTSHVHGATPAHAHGASQTHVHGATPAHVHGASQTHVHGATPAHADPFTSPHVHGASQTHVHGATPAHVDPFTSPHVHGATPAHVDPFTSPHVHGATPAHVQDAHLHGETHWHAVSHALADAAELARPRSLRPLFVGIVHGLAGSAAVALLVLGAIGDPLWALGYLLVFGIGTIAGMVLITTAIAVPLTLAAQKFARFHRALGLATGLASVILGCVLVYEIGFVDGLFTSQPLWSPH